VPSGALILITLKETTINCRIQTPFIIGEIIIGGGFVLPVVINKLFIKPVPFINNKRGEAWKL